MLTAIRQWVIKTMMKNNTGVVQTLPKRDLIELNTQITAQRLMQNGVDPNALKNANQVENAIISMENKQKANLAENIRGGITSSKSAKVFNIEGKELNPKKPIMGGTQTGKELSKKRSDRLRGTETDRIKQRIADRKIESDEPPPGSRGGPDDIAAPVQSAEETIKNMIEAENKKGIASIKNRKMVKDAVDNASPGFVKGDRKYNAQLVADDLAEKKFGKDFYDLDQKQQMDLYGEALDGLSEDFAQGGRAGFKEGSGMTRRSFLKIMGGLAAIPIVGKFLKPIKTAKGIKSVPIIKTDNVPGKPEWFDALVNKVIIEGDDVTKRFATADRQSIHQKTLDDGSVVRVTEDVDDGAVRVEYQNEANVFGDDVLMQYKKPLPDEGAPNPAAEFTTAESGPVGRRYGPDDYEIEVDEVGGTSIKDLDSDVSKLKQYATGKGPTIREIVQNKKRKDKARRITEDPEAQSDVVVRRQGEVNESDYDVPDDAFASGGIARMLGE